MPRRIVSLVPSLSELVWWLGAGDRLVGRTRFCTEPAGMIAPVPIVGGTKNPRIDRIVALAPDLVIANREENRREDVDALRAAGLTVLVTDPNTLDEACAMIAELGELLGAGERAAGLLAAIADAIPAPGAAPGPRVFVAIWKEPLMGLGSAAYGHDLLERAGAVNVLRDRARYPEVDSAKLAALRPDLILLPDEPYPFREADRALFEAIAPARVIDGKLLWWYGPRIPQALRELTALFQASPRQSR